jgi:hypothetical protein
VLREACKPLCAEQRATIFQISRGAHEAGTVSAKMET